jgi:ferredoxin
MKHFKVKNTGSGAVFTVNEGESVLTAALRQGVMLPYSCKNGTCGSCKGHLQSGEVHYPFHPPMALSREEIGDGQALFCQAEPTEDLVIRVREIEAVRDVQKYCYLTANEEPFPLPVHRKLKMRSSYTFATSKAGDLQVGCLTS